MPAWPTPRPLLNATVPRARSEPPNDAAPVRSAEAVPLEMDDLYPIGVTARPLVRNLAPALVREMKRALDALGETEVSAKVESLEAWGRCSCGSDSCSSFYTGPRPKTAWSGEGDHRNIALPGGSRHDDPRRR
jgi:hypothetical protein